MAGKLEWGGRGGWGGGGGGSGGGNTRHYSHVMTVLETAFYQFAPHVQLIIEMIISLFVGVEHSLELSVSDTTGNAAERRITHGAIYLRIY